MEHANETDTACGSCQCPSAQNLQGQSSSVLQELQRLASQYALPADAQHDVEANVSSTVPAYTFFPHADLQGTPGMPCTVSSSRDEATSNAVTSCTSTKLGQCCVYYDPSSTEGVRYAAGHQVCMSISVHQHQSLAAHFNCTVILSRTSKCRSSFSFCMALWYHAADARAAHILFVG